MSSPSPGDRVVTTCPGYRLEMGTVTTLRLRRSAAQLHALAKIEREIRATDPNGRRKYLREFREAFPSYHSVLSGWQLAQALESADVVLAGDYHALPACQRYCARLIAERASASRRPLVLAVEAVCARDQHIVEEWQRGEISERELRERIRYDLDWQYDWEPFYELLQAARAYGAKVYGLDCMPRGDMRKIAVRDHHAAQKIAEIRQQNREAQVVVLFGESHLAPSHLPAELKLLLPRERMLTVLQNLDALYWQAAGERQQVDAVRVNDEAVCVFNATPLEKYESYRQYLDRWRCERPKGGDFGPSFYNLIDALVRFLEIDPYSAQFGHPAKPIVDLLPEICSRNSESAYRRLLGRRGLEKREIDAALEELWAQGSYYVPALNMLLVLRFNLRNAAEQVARLVQLACSGALQDGRKLTLVPPAEDSFYRAVVQHALVYVGSRALYPARPPVREQDYYALYSQPRTLVECRSLYSYREYLEMIDVLLLHKDYEAHREEYLHPPALVEAALQFTGARFGFVTRELGQMFGTELYEAYVSGRFSLRSLRVLAA